MNQLGGTVREPSRPRYGSLAGAIMLALLVASIAALSGFLGGGRTAAKAPSPEAAWAGWAIAGVALGSPIAALPTLGFRVRATIAVPIAVVLAVVVTLLGVAVTLNDKF